MVRVAFVRIADPSNERAVTVLPGSGYGFGLGCVVNVGEARAMRILDNVMGDRAALGATARFGFHENVCHTSS
jgi:hypothetical protein